ncbi:MAG: ABC transporter ATP-binding protein [Sphingomonadales bacterium]|jgi:ABC-type multidrug transport system ATPase subunit
MIDVAGLALAQQGRAVLANVSFTVAPGEIVGLLGLNGAGKSSIIMALAGLLAPVAGRISLNGHAPGSRAARAATGVLLQRPGLPDRLTVAETLALLAGLHGVPVPADLVATLGLDGFAGQRVATLSGGQRQRLALGCALLASPPVLLLDEPATALDAAMRADLAALLAARRAAGAAVLLATHEPAEAEQLCDRVLVLHQGCLLAGAVAADLPGLA